MRLSSHSDYALRVLMALAINPEEMRSVGELASAYGISRNHLAKVAVVLAHGGWVTSKRGRGGGIQLAAKPKDISIGEVVRVTERDFALVECFDAERNTCVISGACSLKRRLASAQEAFFASLDDVTLADLVPNRKKIGRLLVL